MVEYVGLLLLCFRCCVYYQGEMTGKGSTVRDSLGVSTATGKEAIKRRQVQSSFCHFPAKGTRPALFAIGKALMRFGRDIRRRV